MNKIFSLLVLTAVATISFLPDVNAGAKLSRQIAAANALGEANIINLKANSDEYGLGNNISRAEMAKVTANLGGYAPTNCRGNVFRDVWPKLGDLCGYIEALADADVVTTRNTHFNPLNNVSRAEMVKMVTGAMGEEQSQMGVQFRDVKEDMGDLWGFINRAYEMGCINNTYGHKGNFRPNIPAKRGDTFTVAACVSSADLDDEGDFTVKD